MDIAGARQAGYSDDEIASELGRRSGMDVSGAIKAGYSIDEINAESERRGGGLQAAPKQSYEDFKKAFIADQATTYYKGKEKVKDVVRSAMPYARPVLETAGGLGGGVVGAGSGFLGGLGLGAVPGAVAGGTLGFGAMAQTSDMLEEWAGGTPNADRLANRSMVDRAIVDPASNLKTGLESALLGEVAAPIIGGSIKAGKAILHPIESANKAWNYGTKRAAAKRIKDAVSKEQSIVELATKNKARYQELQSEIDGLNLPPAAVADDASQIKMHQNLLHNADGASDMNQASKMKTYNNTMSYLDQAMPQGSLDDFLAAIKAQGAARTNNVSTQASQMAAMDKEAASAQMKQLELAAQKRLKGQADSLYGQVPRDMQMDSTPLYRTLQELGDTVDPAFANPKNMPTRMMNSAEGALAPTPTNILAADGMPYNAPRIAQDMPDKISYDQLMQYNSQVTEALRQARSTGDFAKARNLSEIKNGIQQTLGFAEQTGQGQAVDALRKANSFYRDTYVPAVRQGQTAKNLATTRTGEFRVADEISAGKYLQEGDSGLAAANDFNRLFGQDPNAKKVLQGYAQRDLFDAATANGTQAPSLKAAEAWIAKRTPALKKLGMENEFSGFKDALKQEADLADFKAVLGQDPQTVLKSLLAARGDKDIVRSALDLKTLVQGNTGALNGLKRSISDLMMAEAQISKKVGGTPVITDAKMQTFWQKYEPAMKLIYSADEMKALKNVREVFEIQNRAAKQVVGLDGSVSQSHKKVEEAFAKALPVLSYAGRAARGILGYLAKEKATSIDAFALKAQFDPVFAKELADLGKIGMKNGEKAMNKAIAEWVSRYTAYTTASEISKSYRPNSETDTQY